MIRLQSDADDLPLVYVVRHGETAWSAAGQHTGWTDIPLTAAGEAQARGLQTRLAGLSFSQVWSSPLQRASRTCELAGFGTPTLVDPDLREWNYGSYEGRTTQQIRQEWPSWEIFRDGCPGGESLDALASRADRVIVRLRRTAGNVLVFSSAHILRVLAARWLGIEPAYARYFFLGTAAISVLGYNHDANEPVLRLWNDCGDDNAQST